MSVSRVAPLACFFERRHLAAFTDVITAARRELAIDSARSLLDVGGGNGGLTEEVASGVPRVVVLEPRASARTKGKKRRPEIEFVEGRAERIPFPDGSFDRVMAAGSLHHFADVKRGLGEMHRVLAPGGRLLIFEFSPEGGQGKFLVKCACHKTLQRPSDLAALLSGAGFREVRTSNVAPGYLALGLRPAAPRAGLTGAAAPIERTSTPTTPADRPTNYWEQISKFQSLVARDGGVTPDGMKAVAYLRGFFQERFGTDSVPPRALRNYLAWASKAQSKRMNLLARELALARSLGFEDRKLSRLGVETEYEAAMAEIEVAAAVFAAGGKVTFLRESQSPSADLLIELGGTRSVVEITSLRESEDIRRSEAVHDLLFSKCAFKVGWGGALFRAPSHQELAAFGAQLSASLGEALSTKQHQRIVCGDWIDVWLAVEGSPPYPPGIGTFDLYPYGAKRLDTLLARKLLAKTAQVEAGGAPAIVVIVDAAREWAALETFLSEDLTNTETVLSSSPRWRGLIYSSKPLRGLLGEHLRIVDAGARRLYRRHPEKVTLGTIASVVARPDEEGAVSALADAIVFLEDRAELLPAIG